MRRNILLVILCFVLGFAPSARAKPSCIETIIKADTPLSSATLRKMLFHIYSAQLWTDSTHWNSQKPYALFIKYFVSIDKNDFLERTLEELKRNPDVTEVMLNDYRQKLGFIYPDVKDGDSITALYNPAEGILFCHNDNKLGWMREAELVRPFFDIWFGEHTSEPALRNTLLKL